MDLFKHHHDCYHHAIEERGKLDSRLQIHLAIIASVSGLLAYLFSNSRFELSNVWQIFFFVLLGAAVIFMGFAIFYFIKSWHGYMYKLLATPDDIDGYHQQLSEHYNEFENRNELIAFAMQDYMYGCYRDYATWNISNNDTKSLNLNKAASAIIISFLIAIISLAPFFVDKRTSNSTVLTVKEIENGKPANTASTAGPWAENSKGQSTTAEAKSKTAG